MANWYSRICSAAVVDVYLSLQADVGLYVICFFVGWAAVATYTYTVKILERVLRILFKTACKTTWVQRQIFCITFSLV